MTLLGSRYLTFAETHSFCQMQQTTYTVTQCDTATLVSEQDIFTQQCLSRSRWQTTGSPGCWLSSQTQAHRAQHSHHGVFTPAGCSQKCDGRRRCFHSRKACLSTSHLCLPESGFLSPTCSHVIWTGAAYMYLRGAFMTYVHTSWESDV